MKKPPHLLWAEFRFSVIGQLLSSPPLKGELRHRISELADCEWMHPVKRIHFKIGKSTIERWYYKSINHQNPVEVLRRQIRSDSGTQTAVTVIASKMLFGQYKDHPSWSYQLHFDNLEVVLEMTESNCCSYSSVRRFMQKNGLFKQKRNKNKLKPGAIKAFNHLQSREVRSFEAEYAHSLWHLDFHFGSKRILESDGEYYTPVCLCILDDRTRLACHIQWYLSENTENLVHGFNQAIQKRGLPRELMSDNGGAMTSDEFTEGLMRFSIEHQRILPYSPYQNAKQESFWGQLEGRLVAMLENCKDLSLKLLNDATLAWVEMEYNRSFHDEIKMAPVECLVKVKDVSRDSPSGEDLHQAFLKQVSRTQRRSDGTISLEGTRFEIPSRYRHLKTIGVRVAKWNLSKAFLVDPMTSQILCPLYPLDKTKNATSGRRSIESKVSTEPIPPKDEIAPLLKKLMEDYTASGLPPAYLPKHEQKEDQQ